MKLMERNKQTVWYALFASKSDVRDGNDRRTGEKLITYGKPVETRMNVGWATGSAQLEGYGISREPTRRIVTDDMNCPIDTDTALWIGITPDNGTKHNYVVVGAPERSLNQIVYTVQEVSVS